ncbi:MAG TPA: hypothetical protein VLB45_05645 [Nitrosopumilaceae archaeon]|nr:hypothetical protein [Nitrosopumilaceae archaeon]
MKHGKLLIISGMIIIASGTVFYFQGQSVIGPESSFMYSNPEWITNGQWIVIIGIIVLAAGIVTSKKSNLRLPK